MKCAATPPAQPLPTCSFVLYDTWLHDASLAVYTESSVLANGRGLDVSIATQGGCCCRRCGACCHLEISRVPRPLWAPQQAAAPSLSCIRAAQPCLSALPDPLLTRASRPAPSLQAPTTTWSAASAWAGPPAPSRTPAVSAPSQQSAPAAWLQPVVFAIRAPSHAPCPAVIPVLMLTPDLALSAGCALPPACPQAGAGIAWWGVFSRDSQLALPPCEFGTGLFFAGSFTNTTKRSGTSGAGSRRLLARQQAVAVQEAAAAQQVAPKQKTPKVQKQDLAVGAEAPAPTPAVPAPAPLPSPAHQRGHAAAQLPWSPPAAAPIPRAAARRSRHL